ncbi:MAG: PA2169 family four-helix-bundle protein [Chryseolinea sp.]
MKASKNSSKENSDIIDVLNDLIRINRDRIVGYEKASENLEEGDAILRTLFNQLSEESEKLKEELSGQVVVLGGEPAEDTTTSGKIYRAWMEVKDTFASDDAKSALEACEYGEDAAQKAYAEALEDSTNFPKNIREMIKDQKGLLKISHDLVRNKRDDYEAATQRAHY